MSIDLYSSSYSLYSFELMAFSTFTSRLVSGSTHSTLHSTCDSLLNSADNFSSADSILVNISLTNLLILITASHTGTHVLAFSFPQLNLRKLHHIIRFIITVWKIRHNTVLDAILFCQHGNILLSDRNICLFHALDPVPARPTVPRILAELLDSIFMKNNTVNFF